MEHKIFKRRLPKRVMATVAGAAVISSLALPGIQTAKVHAEAGPVAAADRQQESFSPVDALRQYAGDYGFSSKDTFSLLRRSGDEASVLVRTDNGRSYRARLAKNSGSNEWIVRGISEILNNTAPAADPVTSVKSNASTLGFDAAADHFSLLTMSGAQAVVSVRSGGQTFKVELQKNDGNWEIAAIRGIGDMNHPATYVPASMLPFRSSLTSSISSVPANQDILYQTNTFSEWNWRENGYPEGMSFGVLLQNPRAAATAVSIPSKILDQIREVNFNDELVLYAHLGSVGYRGYGIGIEKVARNGNDITVTVRTKSPDSGEPLAISDTDSTITIDRTAFNFNNPIHITFLDQNGTTLNSYTILPK